MTRVSVNPCPDPRAAPRLVLASTSPRRRSMLAHAGVAHEALDPGVDDGELGHGIEGPHAWTCALAYLKAVAGGEVFVRSGGDLGGVTVLGADTAVIVGYEQFAKPTGPDDARRMILAVQERWHEVVTGVALVSPALPRRELWYDTARVWVGTIQPAELEAYIASGDWRGKAGGYNLSERVNAGWPVRCEGDPDTVMGLPMRRLVVRLASLGLGVERAKDHP